MKRGSAKIRSGSTLFARGVVYLVGIAALTVCVILLPELAREEAVGKPVNPYLTFAFLGGAYTLAVPFFVAIYHTLKLLHYIDHDQAFTKRSISSLQKIKICAMVFSALIIAAVVTGITVSRIMDPREDVTFMVTFGGIFTFVSTVIAVFVAVLQKLVADAVALKSENDLIV
jgi:hypothetical protein